MATVLPTDKSALTLQRYADLAAQLSIQFVGRFTQLDCGPAVGVVAFWLTPPSQAELTAFTATVAGWSWADSLYDSLNRVGITLGGLGALLILQSASAPGLTVSQKARLQGIVNAEASGILALVGTLIGT
jgi:hypothetical protein